MSLGVVIEGMTIAAFMILLLGGKQRREQGWSVLSIMVVIAAVVQAAAMSLTVSPVLLSFRNSNGGVNLLMKYRRIYTKTILASSLVGFSTNPGSCVRSAGVCKLFARLRLQLLL
jgi:formate hydrogenlyase subunit 3/multisubunit Na+/H+ antiporter MnhD subunit